MDKNQQKERIGRHRPSVAAAQGWGDSRLGREPWCEGEILSLPFLTRPQSGTAVKGLPAGTPKAPLTAVPDCGLPFHLPPKRSQRKRKGAAGLRLVCLQRSAPAVGSEAERRCCLSPFARRIGRRSARGRCRPGVGRWPSPPPPATHPHTGNQLQSVANGRDGRAAHRCSAAVGQRDDPR